MKIWMLVATVFVFCCVGCDVPVQGPSVPRSNSGVSEVKTKVQTNANGHTVEQDNIIRRLKMDNTPGSVKHLYVISPMSGQVLLYSTVQGKVTSSGKRLTPKTVAAGQGRSGEASYWFYGNHVNIGGHEHVTSEVLQDDGTYGDSIEYLYWFDVRGVYHQQYISGCEIHVSDQPLYVKNVVINIESLSKEGE